jgi:hypothetical protein
LSAGRHLPSYCQLAHPSRGQESLTGEHESDSNESNGTRTAFGEGSVTFRGNVETPNVANTSGSSRSHSIRKLTTSGLELSFVLRSLRIWTVNQILKRIALSKTSLLMVQSFSKDPDGYFVATLLPSEISSSFALKHRLHFAPTISLAFIKLEHSRQHITHFRE